ncbi:pectinacetylesterase domain containing protein [Musa troglodytarum]|uniref:Pectin acetylesterase n=1 Tax=Musa troglodytarum TaxID=320322 RepID=A0A9E7K0T1_9LILI|nr:pectinacetylesterase domain containing protein [Musa troglodytarum]
MVGAKSGTWIYPFICFFFLLASLEVDASDVPMTLLHSAVAKGAVCLDGSPPAYHFSPGSGSGANNWLVHMEGGGWCRNVEECLERKNNFRGSSNHMKPLSFSGILGKSKKSNPGGAELVEEKKSLNLCVSCLVKDISGATSVRSLYNDVVNLHGSEKNLPSSCTSRLPPSMIKNTLAPSSADPHKRWNACKFNIKSCSSDQLEKMQDFRSQFLRALPASGNSSTGMFIISCYAHCQSGSRDIWLGADSPMIDKMPIAKAVGDWFYGRSVVRKIDCPYPCNSSCRNRVDE